MARDIGLKTLTATSGNQVVTLPFTPTWMRLTARTTGIKPFTGYIDNGDQYSFGDDTSGAVNKAIKIRNTSGTVVMEGTWVSFTTNAVTFNLTTFTTVPQMLLEFGN